MARLLRGVIVALTLAAAAASGQEPGKSEPRPRPPRSPRHHGGPEVEKSREAFKQMSPEERQKWLENFRRWQELPPDQKKSLLDRQESFRKKMREDVERAISESGLELNDEQKKQFGQRYAEERRRLEGELRKQLEELRRPRVKALIEKLKQEFSAPGAAAAPAKAQ